VNIARQPEKLNIPKQKEKKGLLTPDLSYLNKAPQNSLAGKLVKPGLSRESFARDGTTESTSKSKKVDVSALTQERVKVRLGILPYSLSKKKF
jgi:hypothetical protein